MEKQQFLDPDIRIKPLSDPDFKALVVLPWKQGPLFFSQITEARALADRLGAVPVRWVELYNYWPDFFCHDNELAFPTMEAAQEFVDGYRTILRFDR